MEMTKGACASGAVRKLSEMAFKNEHQNEAKAP